jgi:hypothetical protein
VQCRPDNLVMRIEKGFKIDQPDIFVPWDIDENELKQIFKGTFLTNVTTGYYTTHGESLGGLKCEIGFHFDPRKNGRLNELEFFRTDYSDQRKSYEEFQNFFERVFGKATQTRMGTEGFQDQVWNIDGVQIYHTIYDRFGPEEHMTIKRTVQNGTAHNKVHKSWRGFGWLQKLFS